MPAQAFTLTESESRGPPLLRINYAVRFGHQQGGAGMKLRLVDRSKSRFAAYVEGLVSVIGHADRAGPLRPGLNNAVRAQERRADRVAVDRMARKRGKAGQILAFDPAEKHHLPQTGGPHQTPLAYRARLSGTQTRGRARAFRRTRLARFPSPRHAVHRGLRISGLREGEDSPLTTLLHHS